MTIYADYGFYTEEYRQGYTGGNLVGPDAFPFLASQASAYIYNFTQGISDTVTGRALEMVKMATCALTEAMQDENTMSNQAFSGEQKVSSESVGRWSRSFAAATISGAEVEYLDKRKMDILALYLGNLPEFAAMFKVTSYRCAEDAMRAGR